MTAIPAPITALMQTEEALAETLQTPIAEGLAIAGAGLLIVFLALLLISLFIASLPHLLTLVAKVIPEVDDAHSGRNASEGRPDSMVLDDGATLAAIGFVLHTEIQKQLAAEQAGKPQN